MKFGDQQKTLKGPVAVDGIGLHSGKEVQLTLKPAPVGHGIVFVRTDLEGKPRIVANYKNVSNTQLATTIGSGQVSVSTVEHLLAAFQGAGIDNAVVEVDGPEVPILDGSAARFYDAILGTGVQRQLAPRAYVAIRRRVEVKLAEKWAVAEPSETLQVHGSIDWDHPAIGFQQFRYIEGETPFTELASARTFGFLKDVETLKRMGLARGGSLDNAVVLDDVQVLNPQGLRYTNEFVRHKVLDALGDFQLAGLPLRGLVRLHRAGHDLHSQLLCAIFRDPANYEIVDGSQRDEALAASLHAALAHSLLVSV